MKTALLLALSLILLSGQKLPHSPGWQLLAPGLELGYIQAQKPSTVGDSRITVLRIDPQRWELAFAGVSQSGSSSGKTARQWCKSQNFTAAINAGMFDPDFSTHTGFLQAGEHTNSQRVNEYQSVAAFGARRSGLPPFRIFDLDEPGADIPAILKDYASAVQNLRLIKRPGDNRWGQKPRQWSEAALGEDAAGRILFIFSRSPYTMHDFNEELVNAGIDLVAAQHLEGGPEAQLFVQAGKTTLEQFGSFETGYRTDDDNREVWPIPNVLGIRERAQKK